MTRRPALELLPVSALAFGALFALGGCGNNTRNEKPAASGNVYDTEVGEYGTAGGDMDTNRVRDKLRREQGATPDTARPQPRENMIGRFAIDFMPSCLQNAKSRSNMNAHDAEEYCGCTRAKLVAVLRANLPEMATENDMSRVAQAHIVPVLNSVRDSCIAEGKGR